MDDGLDFRLVVDAADVADTAARLAVQRLAEALELREAAHLVVTGGSDGHEVTRRIAASGTTLEWQRVHVWWGDERLVPRGDADRNDAAVEDILKAIPGISVEQLHRMPAQGDPDPVAGYSADLATGIGEGLFDVVLLGIGPDGHVASLFPGRDLGEGPGIPVLEVQDAPKPPPHRLSLTMARLSASRHVVLLTSGEAKRDAVAALRSGGSDLPVCRVRGRESTTLVVDRAAAGA